jgi:hypothetical protein
MMPGPEILDYRGFRLNVQAQGTGWKVFIYRPGAITAESTIPSTMEYADRDACIAEAKVIVDRLMIG